MSVHRLDSSLSHSFPVPQPSQTAISGRYGRTKFGKKVKSCEKSSSRSDRGEAQGYQNAKENRTLISADR